MKKEKSTILDADLSGLVGMWAVLIVDNEWNQTVFIRSMADDEYYICQSIGALDGQPNVARLLTINDLSEWFIIPSREIYQEILSDYHRNGWRYGKVNLKAII